MHASSIFQGAFFGLVIGMTIGIIRFIVEYSFPSPKCGDTGPDIRPGIIKNFHYLYFSVFLFILTGISAITISMLTKPLPPECVSIKCNFLQRYKLLLNMHHVDS